MNQPKCRRCNDTGVWETGNNDLPCPCGQGRDAVFNVATPDGVAQKTGAELSSQARPAPKARFWGPKQEDIPSLNVLGWYRKGWVCGAGVKPIPHEMDEHPKEEARFHFQRGWEAGRQALHQAMRTERLRLKLPPASPLRLLGRGPEEPLYEDEVDG